MDLHHQELEILRRMATGRTAYKRRGKQACYEKPIEPIVDDRILSMSDHGLVEPFESDAAIRGKNRISTWARYRITDKGRKALEEHKS